MEAPNVIRLHGALDATRREEIRTLLEPLAELEDPTVDLSDVRSLDSTALGVFIGLHKRLRYGPLRLANAREEIGDILRVTGLDRVFDVT